MFGIKDTNLGVAQAKGYHIPTQFLQLLSDLSHTDSLRAVVDKGMDLGNEVKMFKTLH